MPTKFAESGGEGDVTPPTPYIPLLDIPLELTSLWYKEIKNINPIQDGLFCGCSWIALPKICHTYPAMMKLGTVISDLKKIKKIYESRETPPPETTIFWYIKKYRYRLHFDTWFLTLLTCIESLKIVLINMVTMLMMSVKMDTPGLFWNIVYDVIKYVHDIINKFLSRDSNYIVDVVICPKFGNFSISMREVIITSIL